MLGDIETALVRYFLLALFDFVIEEFLDSSAIEANEVVMMRSLVEFEHCLAGFEMISMQQPSLFKLGQHTIDCCQTDIHIIRQKDFVDVFGTEMAHRTVLKNVENFQPRQGGLKAAGFQFGRIAWHVAALFAVICFII